LAGKEQLDGYVKWPIFADFNRQAHLLGIELAINSGVTTLALDLRIIFQEINVKDWL